MLWKDYRKRVLKDLPDSIISHVFIGDTGNKK